MSRGRWTSEDYNRYLKANARNENRSAGAVADSKQRTGNGQVPAKKVARLNGQFILCIHSERKCLTDSDGAFSKYAIDALITAGLLEDDDPKVLPESPRKTQSKSTESKTTIEIYRIGE